MAALLLAFAARPYLALAIAIASCAGSVAVHVVAANFWSF